MGRRRSGAGGGEEGAAPVRLADVASRIGERWPEAAMALIGRRQELERRLGRAGLVRFAEEGLALGERRGAEAARAYFQLESRSAHEALARARGMIRLDDWMGTLRLYAEALAASPVELRGALLGGGADSHRGPVEFPAGTDGLRLLLPEEAEVVAGAKSDLALFKLSILHQLARYGSGTYSFDLERLFELRPELAARSRQMDAELATAFGRYFSTFPSPPLARRIFAVLDGARIDRWVAKRYPGAGADLGAVRAHALARRPDLAELRVGEVLLELLVQWSLGDDPRRATPASLGPVVARLVELAAPVVAEGATVYTAAGATVDCYGVLSQAGLELRAR